MSNKNRIGLMLLQFLFIIIGGTFEVSFKILTNLKKENGKELAFDHLYFLILVYFLSELLSSIFYCMRWKKKKPTMNTINPLLIPDETGNDNEENRSLHSGSEQYINEIKTIIIERPLSKRVNFLYFLLPALFDALSKVLIGVGIKNQGVDLNSIPNTFIVLVAGIYAKVILKKNFNGYAVIGFVLFLLSLASFIVVDAIANNFFNSLMYFNLSCVCLGELMQLIQCYIQERNLKKLGVHCLQEVAIEGLWGTIIFGVLLICFQFTPCNIDNGSDSGNVSNIIKKNFCGSTGKVGNTLEAFKEILQNKVIYCFIVFPVIGVFYSIFGVILIKRTQTTIRVITDNCKIVVSIVLCLIILNVISTLKSKEWSYYYIPGFFLAIVSTLIFVEAIKLPCLREVEDIQNPLLIETNNTRDQFIS